MIGQRAMGLSLLYAGDIARGKAHLDHAVALYDPAEHRPLATRFAVDARSSSLSHRALALWLLGYPEAALEDAERALQDAREIGQAATLMNMLFWTAVPLIYCGEYAAGSEQLNEAVALADERGSLPWKANGMTLQGWVFALTGKASNAVQMIDCGMTAARSTGSVKLLLPWHLSHLAWAHATVGHHDEAWRCIGEAMTAMATTKERWCEAEVHRVAGEIVLMSSEPNAARAEAYFERALAVARQQQAKSWELRAAMGMARLWRDQGKRDEACELLAPVYGWFTEGFDTLDLKEAKVLLDELHA
jgi:predicted ATPase